MISLSNEKLEKFFGDALEKDFPMSTVTNVKIGGKADYAVTVKTEKELKEAVAFAFKEEIPFFVLGGGCNILVSDKGIRELVIINRAKELHFDEENLQVTASSGEKMVKVGKQVSKRGYTGMEWATGIPGTVGGAVVGNAGAHGGDTAGSLVSAEVYHPEFGLQTWAADQFNYQYRGSRLKHDGSQVLVLSATFSYEKGDQAEIDKKMKAFLDRRQSTQPNLPSTGSTFKNPPGNFSAKLIQESGLKGTRIGGVQINELHGNFFCNVDKANAKASDFYALVKLAQKTVLENYGIELHPEIQFIGDWDFS